MLPTEFVVVIALAMRKVTLVAHLELVVPQSGAGRMKIPIRSADCLSFTLMKIEKTYL